MGLFSKWFEKNKQVDPIDFGKIRVDMHSHLIPGIDDGAPDVAVAIDLVRGLETLGYKKLITTPHVMSDFYRNTSDDIKRGEELMRKELAGAGVNVGLQAAAEYYCDDHFESLIARKDLLTFGDNYVLFELPFAQPSSNMKNAIFEMQMAGYKPILAHPERYGYWHTDFEQYQSLVDKDVLLQLNINSLNGVYSPTVKKTAMRLLDEGLISFVGTDCHHHGHLESLTESSRNPSLHTALEKGQILNASL